MELAEQVYYDDNEMEASSPFDRAFKELREEIKSTKAIELKSRFERVSPPDPFLKIFSFADSPSLIRSTSVSRAWKESINGSSELFLNFRMEGKGEQICKGLGTFSELSKDSMKRMELGFGDKLEPSLQERLGNNHQRFIPESRDSISRTSERPLQVGRRGGWRMQQSQSVELLQEAEWRTLPS